MSSFSFALKFLPITLIKENSIL
uniref:Uncharacterized protein n=1 Tax=Lepeophtheirus salmonis TaxID=72036 RepID=A0A0K2TF44_LEPSM